MKKIIYLCLFTVLALNFNCNKDEIQLDEDSKTIEQKSLDEINGLGKLNLTNNDLNIQSESIVTSGGDESYLLYLDMDLLEEEYNNDSSNPSYIGPYNIFFRNLMSNHFTIYSINVSTSSECANIERWHVSLDELNTYLISIGENIVSNDNEDDEIGANTGGGNTSNSNSLTGEKDKTKPKEGTNPNEPDPNEPESILLDYSSCFN
jgi:hypothetical protein